MFEVITSDLSGAGTDANVFVTLYGDGGTTGREKGAEKGLAPQMPEASCHSATNLDLHTTPCLPGETPPLKLDNPGNDFEQGKTDVFTVRAAEVGEPKALKVMQDGKGFGAAWHLEMITVYTK